MYSSEIKQNCRVIQTGLYGKANYEILASVDGQLSDGMWENSPAMEGYWLFDHIEQDKQTGEVLIYISKQWGEYRFNRYKQNRFLGMSDSGIRTWFGKKIKQIIKQEIKDAWENHPIEWKRDCEVESKYLGYDEAITPALCYKAYDKLLGRRER